MGEALSTDGVDIGGGI